MKELVIDIQNGQISSFHDDSFSLSFLGRLKIQRASEILFDEDSQSFYVLLSGQSIPFSAAKSFKTYNGARDFEVYWLNECRKAFVNPDSTEGEDIADVCKINFSEFGAEK